MVSSHLALSAARLLPAITTPARGCDTGQAWAAEDPFFTLEGKQLVPIG
jgi:hypothetical protein